MADNISAPLLVVGDETSPSLTASISCADFETFSNSAFSQNTPMPTQHAPTRVTANPGVNEARDIFVTGAIEMPLRDTSTIPDGHAHGHGTNHVPRGVVRQGVA